MIVFQAYWKLIYAFIIHAKRRTFQNLEISYCVKFGCDKKRIYEDENRNFKPEWEEDFTFSD